jgi:hypothetical protein
LRLDIGSPSFCVATKGFVSTDVLNEGLLNDD